MISVIIPTYNRSTLVAHAVESVLAQSYQNIEVIVADDGSNDDTEQVISAYVGRVKYLKLLHRGHPGPARNVGLQAAQGEFIAFLDDDDEWLPEKLQEQMNAIAEFPSAGFVSTNAYRRRPFQQDTLFFENRSDLSGWLFSKLIPENFVIASSMLVRKSVFNRAGEFNEENWSRGLEDYDLWLRVAACTQGIYLSKPLLFYDDIPTTSIRSSTTLMAYWQYLYKTLFRAERFIRRQKLFLSEDTQDLLSIQKRTYINLALEEAIRGKFHINAMRLRTMLVYWDIRQKKFSLSRFWKYF